MSPLDRGVVVVSSARELGGAEVYMLTLLDGIARKIPIDVLLSDRAPDELVRRVAETGASVTIVPGLARRPSPGAAVRLALILRRRRPALIHVNLSDQGDGIAAILAATIARVPLSATLNLVLPRRRRVLEQVSRRCLRLIGVAIAPSGWVGAYLDSQGVAARVVPYGVHAAEPRPDSRVELGATPDEIVVGGIGRLHQQKGWDVLCRAAARVKECEPSVCFVVVGDGPERDRLIAPGHGSSVRFIGYRERAAGLLSGMDVLVVPSRYEAFGLVAVEAMLASVPVVASRVEALPEVVGDAGVLVPPEDPEALAVELIALIRSPSRRAELARRGADRARSRFGCERMFNDTADVWMSVAGSVPDSLSEHR